MFLVETTEYFEKWLRKLRDRKAKAKIFVKLKQLEFGNFGDHKSVGSGLSELKIAYGPGYRLYYTIRDQRIVIMVIGGDKSSQSKDIEKAQSILKRMEIQNDS